MDDFRPENPNAKVNLDPQGSPQIQAILIFDNFSCQSPHPHMHLCIRIPFTFPYTTGWDLFISELLLGHHCHIPMCGLSESSQNPLGCIAPPPPPQCSPLSWCTKCTPIIHKLKFLVEFYVCLSVWPPNNLFLVY